MSENEGGMSARKERKFPAIAVSVCAVGLALIFGFLAGWTARWYALGTDVRNLLWAVGEARDHYYTGLTEDDIYERLFDAFRFDSYSQFYTREEYEAVRSMNAGEGADTGLSFSRIETNGLIRIYRVTGNSPAEAAGLSDGMYVFRFGPDRTDLRTGSATELLAFLSGRREELVLEAGFDGSGEDAAFYTLRADDYYISYCLYRDSGTAVRFLREGKTGELLGHAAAIGGLSGLPEDTAYIRLDRFYGTAAEEFEACLAYMRERGRTNLVVDLRRNGGGSIDVFRQIAGFFPRTADKGRVLACYAVYNDGSRTELYTQNNYSRYFGEDTHIKVLADENTASASECLIGTMVSCGALQYDGIYLREEGGTARTYGKGIMQTTIMSPYGGALKLTTARVYWPNGTTIHGTGVRAEDGAIPVPAPVLPGKTDIFLERFLGMIA